MALLLTDDTSNFAGIRVTAEMYGIPFEDLKEIVHVLDRHDGTHGHDFYCVKALDRGHWHIYVMGTIPLMGFGEHVRRMFESLLPLLRNFVATKSSRPAERIAIFPYKMVH